MILGSMREMKIESSILDFPKAGLDITVFENTGKIKKKHKDKILNKLYSKLEEKGYKNYGKWIDKVKLVGSMTTYRYAGSTDVDIHSVVDLDVFIDEEFDSSISNDKAKDILNTLGKELSSSEKETLEGTKHILEYYFEMYHKVKRISFTVDDDGFVNKVTYKNMTKKL